jgi:hypothetical protein
MTLGLLGAALALALVPGLAGTPMRRGDRRPVPARFPVGLEPRGSRGRGPRVLLLGSGGGPLPLAAGAALMPLSAGIGGLVVRVLGMPVGRGGLAATARSRGDRSPLNAAVRSGRGDHSDVLSVLQRTGRRLRRGGSLPPLPPMPLVGEVDADVVEGSEDGGRKLHAGVGQAHHRARAEEQDRREGYSRSAEGPQPPPPTRNDLEDRGLTSGHAAPSGLRHLRNVGRGHFCTRLPSQRLLGLTEE